MLRPILAFAAVLCLLSTASASLSPRNDPLALSKEALRTARATPPAREARQTAAPDPNEEFRLTDQTEIRLNGRPCRYQDVPPAATIQLLEVGPDRRTVLRIHFRTRR